MVYTSSIAIGMASWLNCQDTSRFSSFTGDLTLLLLLLFILVPLAEIAMFMVVGDLIGFWPTLGIILITALIGAYLLKQQSLSVLNQAQMSSRQGQLPIHSVVDGIFLLLAGAFLLTPGIITDVVGFSFMVPGVRRFLGSYLFKKFSKNISVTSFGFESYDFQSDPDSFSDRPSSRNSPPDMPDSDGPIIDAEVIEPDEDDKTGKSRSPGSPWKKK